MNEQDKDILCRLIRDHEDLVGSSRAAVLALQAFMNSVMELKCPLEQVREQYLELSEVIKNTQPKIIPLIHLIEEFEKEIDPHFGKDLEQIQAKAVEILKAKSEKLKSKVAKIIQTGLTCIKDGDVIVVHTASADVMNMIAAAKEVMDRRIKIIVLKQDFLKTKKLINILTQANVELETIPEFSLSHYIDHANKMFIGALSITYDQKVVCPVGTAGITSLCHFHQIPVYLFANTLKFSHGASEDQHIHEKKVAQVQDSVSYVLTTYSHDLVDLKMVDFLVTEERIVSKNEIEAYVANIHGNR